MKQMEVEDLEEREEGIVLCACALCTCRGCTCDATPSLQLGFPPYHSRKCALGGLDQVGHAKKLARRAGQFRGSRHVDAGAELQEERNLSTF